MTWHALTPAKVIAAKADVREIDATILELKKNILAQALRMAFPRGDKRSRDEFTFKLMKRKLANVMRAREIWFERFQEDNGQ
jgi:hypothetical protein